MWFVAGKEKQRMMGWWALVFFLSADYADFHRFFNKEKLKLIEKKHTARLHDSFLFNFSLLKNILQLK